MNIAICEDEAYWLDTLRDSILAWADAKKLEVDLN